MAIIIKMHLDDLEKCVERLHAGATYDQAMTIISMICCMIALNLR